MPRRFIALWPASYRAVAIPDIDRELKAQRAPHVQRTVVERKPYDDQNRERREATMIRTTVGDYLEALSRLHNNNNCCVCASINKYGFIEL